MCVCVCVCAFKPRRVLLVFQFFCRLSVVRTTHTFQVVCLWHPMRHSAYSERKRCDKDAQASTTSHNGASVRHTKRRDAYQALRYADANRALCAHIPTSEFPPYISHLAVPPMLQYGISCAPARTQKHTHTINSARQRRYIFFMFCRGKVSKYLNTITSETVGFDDFFC